jgi:hypothetical protein
MKLKVCTALLGAALCSVAHADVKYTETMTMEGKNAAGSEPTRTTTYLKAGHERTEQKISMGPMVMNMISVSSCPKKLRMRFDPELKIYTSAPINNDSVAKATDAKPAPTKPAPKPTGKTGKIVMTSNVQKLGIEEIAGRKARHYIIDQSMTSEGCAGTGTQKFRTEVWMADYDMPVFACRALWNTSANQTTPADGGCSISSEYKGDQAALTEAYRGLPVKRKMTMGDTVMIWQLTELSEAKLDDALFTPRADWKLVSDEEFDKQRQAAMMKAMTSGASAGGDGGNDEGDEGGTMEDVTEDTTPVEEEKPKEEPKKKKKKFGNFKLPF